MRKPNLIPMVDAGHFPNEVDNEFEDEDISTHYQSDIITLDWEEHDYLPLFKQWLVEQYGESIKEYDSFAIMAT